MDTICWGALESLNVPVKYFLFWPKRVLWVSGGGLGLLPRARVGFQLTTDIFILVDSETLFYILLQTRECTAFPSGVGPDPRRATISAAVGLRS